MSHIHELIDYTVEVFIVHNNAVLIRLHDKYNIWTCPWGHIELDEDPNQWAIREAKEETWLDIILYDWHQKFKGHVWNQKELVPPIFMNIHQIWETKHHHVWLVYFWYSESKEVNPLAQDDISNDRKWMTVDDLNSSKDISEHVKVYWIEAIKTYN